MKFDVLSHEGAGPVRLGMAPGEVRAILGTEFKNFKRDEASTYPVDYFAALGCFVYYDDEHGLVQAVEFAEPAQPTLDGLNLLSLPFADFVQRMRELDPAAAVENDGVTSFELGIGGWAPHCKDEPELPCEAIIVFVRGYYD